MNSLGNNFFTCAALTLQEHTCSRRFSHPAHQAGDIPHSLAATNNHSEGSISFNLLKAWRNPHPHMHISHYTVSISNDASVSLLHTQKHSEQHRTARLVEQVAKVGVSQSSLVQAQKSLHFHHCPTVISFRKVKKH